MLGTGCASSCFAEPTCGAGDTDVSVSAHAACISSQQTQSSDCPDMHMLGPHLTFTLQQMSHCQGGLPDAIEPQAPSQLLLLTLYLGQTYLQAHNIFSVVQDIWAITNNQKECRMFGSFTFALYHRDSLHWRGCCKWRFGKINFHLHARSDELHTGSGI